MFARLIITFVIVWFLAEMLCRLVLQRSLAAAASGLFGFNDAPQAAPRAAATPRAAEPNASLRRLVDERRRKLAETKSRLELAMEAAELAEQLALREAELAAVEGRLAEVERRRAV